MPGKLKREATSVFDDLESHVRRIYDQAQNSAANHQKNFVALYKIHTEAATHTESIHGGESVKLTGERRFEDEFMLQVTKVLVVKKGTSQADRVVKFIGGYTRFANEKAMEARQAREVNEDDDSDTTASRFTERLLNFLMKGFLAKDKTVRYRVVQLIAEMVSHLGEVDEDIYTKLRASLVDRIHDREVPVRVQAVIGLSKLSSSEGPDDIPEGELGLQDHLLNIAAHDPSPEVRRASLMNLPVTKTTLPAILARTRDTDTTLRKLVYASILEPNTTQEHDGVSIGATHPRALTIAQREQVVKCGLGDREPSVRSAAANLIGTWFQAMSDLLAAHKKAEGGIKPEGENAEVVPKPDENLIAFLQLFDLQEGTIAQDALLSIFETRPDIFNNLEFGEAYWSNLTHDTAFLARVFVDRCLATKNEGRLENALPVVTALAFRIQQKYNELGDDIEAEEEERLLGGDINEEERQRKEDQRVEKESVIAEMLRLAVNLDYADEIGRRKMFGLMRDMLSRELLPETLINSCMDVLRKLSTNERDLIRVVVEIVNDLRVLGEEADGEEPPKDADADVDESVAGTPVAPRTRHSGLFNKPTEELTAEEKQRSDEIDLRCLSICIAMLERVNSTFEENSTLTGVLEDLIVPCVKRKETQFREKGLISLGMCCLIAKSLARQSFSLFINQIHNSPEVLKIRLLQTVFDMLMVHEQDFLGKNDEYAANIIKFLNEELGREESEAAQALLCMGMAKLVLAGMITDEVVLKNLIMAYLSPLTAENQELRQCLSYFFPVYCYSAPANQRRMREIFIPMLVNLGEMRKSLDDEDDMVTAAQVGTIFVDWTDPAKATEARCHDVDELIQFDMACDILKALLKSELEREDKKVICQLLPKLHIPDAIDEEKARTLKLLVDKVRTRRPIRDTAAKNAFTKFETAVAKKFEKQLEDFNEEEFRKLESLKDLFAFVDDIISDDEDEEVVEIDPPKKKGKKRRSESIAGTSDESDSRASPAPKRGKAKAKTKRPRLSTSDDEDDFDDDATETAGTPPPAAPKRSMPKRAAAGKKKPVQVITISSDDDEDEKSTPEPPRRGKASRKPTVKMEPSEAGNDSNEEPEGTPSVATSSVVSHDSIIDDSDEEEEEVSGLVLGDDD